MKAREGRDVFQTRKNVYRSLAKNNLASKGLRVERKYHYDSKLILKADFSATLDTES